MPTIYSWTTDLDGNVQDRDDTELDIEVAGFNEATSKLAENLVNLASDDFLANALNQWFTNVGKISTLDMGGGLFWHVELR